MRVYLESPRTVVKPNGSKVCYRGNAFYEVDDDVGQRWVAEGIACKATNSNEIIEDERSKKKKKDEDVTLEPLPDFLQPASDFGTTDEPDKLDE